VVMIGEPSVQYLANWHITLLGSLAKVVIVLLVVGCLFFSKFFGYWPGFHLMGLV